MKSLCIRFLKLLKRIYWEISVFCSFLFYLIYGIERSTVSEELSQAELMAAEESMQALETARGEVLANFSNLAEALIYHFRTVLDILRERLDYFIFELFPLEGRRLVLLTSRPSLSKSRSMLKLLRLVRLAHGTLANGSTKRIDSFLADNKSLLDAEFAALLSEWFTVRILDFSDSWYKLRLAELVGKLGNLMMSLKSSDPSGTLAIAIESYNLALNVYMSADKEKSWLNYKKDLKRASTENNLSFAYLRYSTLSPNPGEQIENAIIACRNVLQTQKEGSDAWVRSSINLGSAYFEFEKYHSRPREQLENCIITLKRAIEFASERRMPEAFAKANYSLGTAYNALAKYSSNPREEIELSINAFKISQRIFTKLKLTSEFGGACNGLASAYISLHPFVENPKEQIENAITIYHQALQICTEKNDPRAAAGISSNLGCAYIDSAGLSSNPQEQIENALIAYKNSLRISREANLPLLYATISSNLGKAYMVLAEFDPNPRCQIQNAIALFCDSLRVQTEANMLQSLARSNLNLGLAYGLLSLFEPNSKKQIEHAIKSCRRASRVLAENYSWEHLQIGRAIGNLGFSTDSLALAIEGYSLAIMAVEGLRSDAIDPARKAEIVSQAIEVYANLVQTYVNTEQYDKALEVVDRSKARNLVELLSSKDLYPKGEIPPEVIQRLDELRGSIARAERDLNRAQSANGLTRSPIAGSDGITGPESPQSLAFERIQQERTQKVGEQLLQLKQELDRLIQDQIQPIDPSFSLSQKVQPLSIDQLRATLPDEQTVIVSWYLAGPQLLAFILHGDALQPICHCYPEPTLEALSTAMNAYLNAYRSENNSWQAGLPAALDHFSRLLELEALMEKIKQIAPGADQLILIPHRFLHLLPLHAMPVAEAAPTPLQDHFSRGVRYAPSLQVLQVVQQRQPTPPHSLFALQNPTQDLLYSDLEVEAIQSLFAAKATVLKRSEASKAAMEQQKGALTNSACLHFACHGYFNFEQPLLSALLLAGSVLDTAPDDLDADRHLPQPNGNVIDLSECLTLLDLFQLDLRQARLVALSACETGLSDLNSLSDEVVGLSSGFLYAGCNNVIGSLWSVPDISTGLLMAQFYRLLMAQTCQGQPGDVALALKQAQHWLRTLSFAELAAQRSTIPEAMRDNFEHDLKWLKQRVADSGDNYPFRSPYYWAAFTAVGQ